MCGEMSHTIMLGGGLCGLTAAMMLARDGHRVTVLERDPSPVPEDPEAAWERWRRDGVVQFRQAHYLQPLGRAVLERELPDVLEAFKAAGAFRFDPIAPAMPPAIADRAPRAGDERFVTWTGRRSTLEWVVARAAEPEPGVEIRRGVGVTALETRRIDGRVHVTAVRTDAGDRVAGDLVVDAMGRGSTLPKLLPPPAATRRRGGRGHAASSTTRASSAGDGAGGPRADQHAGRHVLDPHAPGRQRHLVRHAVRLGRRPAAEGAARPGASGPRSCAPARATRTGSTASRSRRVMPMGGVVDRVRSSRQRRRAAARRGQPRRRVGLHEPVDGARDVARARPRRDPAPGGARGGRATRPTLSRLRRRDRDASCGRGTTARCSSTARGWRRSSRCATARRRRRPQHIPGAIGRALPAAMGRRRRRLPRGPGDHRLPVTPRDVFSRPGFAEHVLEAAAGAVAGLIRA